MQWKLPIITSLLIHKNKRFKDILLSVDKITPGMLSKELKELELNTVVKRSVYDSTPVLIEYEHTESGKTITKVLDVMVEWRLHLRRTVIEK